MLRFSTAAPPRPKSVQSAISRSIKGVLAPEASLFSTELSTASVEHRLLSKKRHRYWNRVQSGCRRVLELQPSLRSQLHGREMFSEIALSRMPRTYSSIEKTRAELSWVNETPDPNKSGGLAESSFAAFFAI